MWVKQEPLTDLFQLHLIQRMLKKKFGKYHIIIFAPKGANIAYIEETLNKYDGKNHLNEVLFPPETEYVTLYKNHGKKLAIIIINL